MNAIAGRAHNFLDRLEEIFMSVALAFMTVLTFIQVILRYLFDTGFVWSLEATTYTFAWMVLVGMSYCVRERAHIAVDLVVGRLPPVTRRRVALLAIGLCVAYCLFMVYGGAIFVDRLMVLGNNPACRLWPAGDTIPAGRLETLHRSHSSSGLWGARNRPPTRGRRMSLADLLAS
jgi:TRAP-type C4-dicarboxylate transport system permease small subunit